MPDPKTIGTIPRISQPWPVGNRVNTIEEVRIPKIGPNCLSISFCIYPLIPISSQSPAETAETITHNQRSDCFPIKEMS